MAARGGYLNYALLVVPILLTMNLTRPLADTWPDTVTRLRNKDRSAVGTFRTAFQRSSSTKGQTQPMVDTIYNAI